MERQLSCAFPVLHRSSLFVVVLFVKLAANERKHEMLFLFLLSAPFSSGWTYKKQKAAPFRERLESSAAEFSVAAIIAPAWSNHEDGRYPTRFPSRPVFPQSGSSENHCRWWWSEMLHH